MIATTTDRFLVRRSLNRFRYGPNDIDIDLSGHNIAQAIEALVDLMNYDPLTVEVYVDGRRVWDKEKFVLPVGATVLFWRERGRKGSGLGEKLDRLADILEANTKELRRIADHFDPPPANIVGSAYVAEKAGLTSDFVGQLARHGTIPKNCIVPGSGDGKVWRFYRSRIDKWVESR